jgi:hypothetical protein
VAAATREKVSKKWVTSSRIWASGSRTKSPISS